MVRGDESDLVNSPLFLFWSINFFETGSPGLIIACGAELDLDLDWICADRLFWFVFSVFCVF